MRRTRSAAGRSSTVIEANGAGSPAAASAPAVGRPLAQQVLEQAVADPRRSPWAARPARQVSSSASSTTRCAGTPAARGGLRQPEPMALAQRGRHGDRAAAAEQRAARAPSASPRARRPSRAAVARVASGSSTGTRPPSTARAASVDFPAPGGPRDHHERARRVAQHRRAPAPPQPRHAAVRRERAPPHPVPARPGHPRAAARACSPPRAPCATAARPAVRRQVVVVALEPAPPQPDRRGERVQLLEFAVGRHVAPRR